MSPWHFCTKGLYSCHRKQRRWRNWFRQRLLCFRGYCRSGEDRGSPECKWSVPACDRHGDTAHAKRFWWPCGITFVGGM